MSKTTAPCGHPGEHVIGAYVRCLKGCAKDPFVQPRGPVAKRRGQPGHVDYCACKVCTTRRRTKEVVLRTKDGKEVRIPWDGATDHLTWRSTLSGYLRHWKLVDADGDVIEEGTVFEREQMQLGDEISLDFFTPTTKLAVTYNWKRQLPFDDYLGYRPWEDRRKLRQACKSMNFGHQSMNFGHPSSSREGLRGAALSVQGVLSAEVYSREYGEVDVVITETVAAGVREEYEYRRAVRERVRENVAAGVQVRVRLDTPLSNLEVALNRFRCELVLGGDRGGDRLDEVENEVYQRLKGKWPGVRFLYSLAGRSVMLTLSYMGASGTERRHVTGRASF